MLVSVLFAAAMMGMPMHGACMGGDSSIVSAKVISSKVDANDVVHFRVAVTVTNKGMHAQPGDTLESVALYQNDDKTDTKGLQPLKAGASQTVVFSFKRNADTEKNSTNLHFVITGSTPMSNCNPHNDSMNITV